MRLIYNHEASKAARALHDHASGTKPLANDILAQHMANLNGYIMQQDISAPHPIGAKVRVESHVDDAEIWNRDDIYIAGVNHYGNELEYTISTEWPPSALTDGFGENDLGLIWMDDELPRPAHELLRRLVDIVHGYAHEDGSLLEHRAADWMIEAALKGEKVWTPEITKEKRVCPHCDGKTFYISKDVATGQEVEVSCLWCDETGFVPEKQFGQKTPATADENGDRGWIGVDFDGTLAHYNGFKGHELKHLGSPIMNMVGRVQQWLLEGYKVKIFTARADDAESIPHIQDWLEANGLPRLEVTNIKDRYMDELWDDRAVQVAPNTGHPTCSSPRGLDL